MDTTTVMIVDDEKLVVEDLINIFDWEGHGFEIVAIAVNGKQALNKFKEHEPQIVITDIKMPFMDGIELIRHIRALNTKTKILLLTAYSDFSYAKQAIQYGITDYMIKSEINDQSIKTKLIELREIVRSEAAASFMLTQKMIWDFFDSGLQDAHEDILPARDLFHKPYCYVIVEEDMPLAFLGDMGSTDDAATGNGRHCDVLSCCRSVRVPGLEWVSESEISRHHMLIILQNEAISQNAIRSATMQFANMVMQELNESFRHSFTLYVIPQKMNLIDMKKLYITRHKRFFAKYLRGNGKIYDLLDPLLDWGESIEVFDDRPVLEFIEKMDDSGLKGHIDNLFEWVLPPHGSYTGLVQLCRNLYMVLKKSTRELPAFADKPDVSTPGNKQLWFNAQDIHQWYVQMFSALLTEKKKIHRNNYSPAVINAMDYMYKNYENTCLTINHMANYVGLSSGRLSVLFKKETGETVNDFLTDVRIAQAKKLLNQGGYKVYEVASLVGYGSSQYFSQIFYKQTGFYPNKYKRGEQ